MKKSTILAIANYFFFFLSQSPQQSSAFLEYYGESWLVPNVISANKTKICDQQKDEHVRETPHRCSLTEGEQSLSHDAIMPQWSTCSSRGFRVKSLLICKDGGYGYGGIVHLLFPYACFVLPPRPSLKSVAVAQPPSGVAIVATQSDNKTLQLSKVHDVSL